MQKGCQRKREEKMMYGYKKTQTCFAIQQSSGNVTHYNADELILFRRTVHSHQRGKEKLCLGRMNSAENSSERSESVSPRWRDDERNVKSSE